MKKVLKKLLLIIAIIIGLLLMTAIIIPTFFKEQIKEKVVTVANERLNAELAIGDFGITMLRNFPNLTFRLKDVSVTGLDKFDGDTLAGLKSLNLVFDLGSILSRSGYRIRAIDIDRPVANALILEDGTTNYDIMKERGAATETVKAEASMTDKEDDKKEKELAFRLDKFIIKDGSITYTDFKGGLEAGIDDLDLSLRGDMAKKETSLILTADMNGVDLEIDGLKYLNNTLVSSRFDIVADMEDNVFRLKDNYLSINDLRLLFTGMVGLDGEDIITDLEIGTDDTEFKSLLSLIPAVFMTGFEELETDGSFSISGNVKGRYSSADSLLPDVLLELLIKEGYLSYPDLPGQISDINLNALVSVDGSDLDNTIVDLQNFHFLLADNPFDMSLTLSTPISDPGVDAELKGKINLTALSEAVPLNVESLTGIIDAGLKLRGRMSMLENNDFDSFEASGGLTLSGSEFIMEGLPPLAVEMADFRFTSQYASLEELNMDVAGNIINMTGKLENYIPFVFDKDTIIGRLDLYSAYLDLDKIMSYLPVDTLETEDDTLAFPRIEIPGNIDFEFTSTIDRLTFKPLEAVDIRGNIIMREGILKVQNTGLHTLGGEMVLNAQYDSVDSLAPHLTADLSVQNMGIQQSFNTFNTVRKLAPVAEGMGGDISMSFTFSSLIGEGFIPVPESVSGSGKINSREIQLVSSPVYEKVSTVLQLGEDYTNTFRDLNLFFEVRDGRVYIKPFDTKLGDIKVNISGDHGLDRSLNYLMKLEVPASSLPEGMSNLLTGLAANAALMGIQYYQPETIKMNVSIGGTIKNLEVRPSLGQSEGESVGEAIKETAARLVDDKVEEVKTAVSDEARQQADRILGEAHERSDLLKAEAARRAQTIRDEADRNARKLIDEAADKGALARMTAQRAAEKLRSEADKKANMLMEETNKQADNIMSAAEAKADSLINK